MKFRSYFVLLGFLATLGFIAFFFLLTPESGAVAFLGLAAFIVACHCLWEHFYTNYDHTGHNDYGPMVLSLMTFVNAIVLVLAASMISLFRVPVLWATIAMVIVLVNTLVSVLKVTKWY
ncbi:MAG: hypothetical protein UW63_C0008G0024 [Candidatus Uhrbacteria bacterium GW2011_GWF2_44_350]|uniref:Uncharacterized protein n=1 Tax=Candidatus Uhrbacteria bacterium GW2011_GWF2_44_350 TaxID=1619000 RepID=A0A0G1JK91_9BACT|nr:MAG: hypothetical protein UW63_C0008G0024 [Candidatus Uhrbacteria bacterium GW2011_GWF2_44_350]HBR80740.1 hypothetical protein [Candidatus Uhrbacteria bacterium]